MPRDRKRQPATAKTTSQHPSLTGHAPAGKPAGTQNLNGIGHPHQVGRRELRLEDDEQRFPLPRRKRDYLVILKNNKQVDIRNVDALMADFRSLRKREPTHFQALLAIAKAQNKKVSRKCIRDLKEWRYLSGDGTIREDVREILVLAGPELEEPYLTESGSDKLKLAMAKEEIEDASRKRIRKLLKPDEPDQDSSKGPSP